MEEELQNGTASETELDSQAITKPAVIKVRERRTEHMTLAITPTLKAQLKTVAEQKKCTVTALINDILEQVLL